MHLAFEHDFAARGQHAHDGREQRRLARAVRPDHRDDLARTHREAGVHQRVDQSVRDRELPHLEYRGVGLRHDATPPR